MSRSNKVRGFSPTERIGIAVVNPRGLNRLSLESYLISLGSFHLDGSTKLLVSHRVTDSHTIMSLSLQNESTPHFVTAYEGGTLSKWTNDEDGTYKESYEMTPGNLQRLASEEASQIRKFKACDIPAATHPIWSEIVTYVKRIHEVCMVMET